MIRNWMIELRRWWRSILPTRIDVRDEPPTWINKPERF